MRARSHDRECAEVYQFRPAVFGTANVARANIAMHHPSRMDEGQRRRDVEQQTRCALPRDRSELAAQGYWSALTSSPSARASSMRRSSDFMRPQFSLPEALR